MVLEGDLTLSYFIKIVLSFSKMFSTGRLCVLGTSLGAGAFTYSFPPHRLPFLSSQGLSVKRITDFYVDRQNRQYFFKISYSCVLFRKSFS